MSKSIAVEAMDAGLANIADTGNFMHLVSQAPAVYADVFTYSLGVVPLTLGDGNGAYTIQDGVVSGRRLTVVQQSVLGGGDGVANHVVIIDSALEEIKAVTTAPNYNIITDIAQSVPGYDVWEIEDPT
jgi:hypothetical protein